MDTAHAPITQGNRHFKKLSAKSTLLLLGPVAVWGAIFKGLLYDWNVIKLSTNVVGAHAIGYGNCQRDFLRTNRYILQAYSPKALTIINAVEFTPSLGVSISVQDYGRSLVIDQHAGQKRKRHRHKAAVDEREVAAIISIFSTFQVGGQRDQIL